MEVADGRTNFANRLQCAGEGEGCSFMPMYPNIGHISLCQGWVNWVTQTGKGREREETGEWRFCIFSSFTGKVMIDIEWEKSAIENDQENHPCVCKFECFRTYVRRR